MGSSGKELMDFEFPEKIRKDTINTYKRYIPMILWQSLNDTREKWKQNGT